MIGSDDFGAPRSGGPPGRHLPEALGLQGAPPGVEQRGQGVCQSGGGDGATHTPPLLMNGGEGIGPLTIEFSPPSRTHPFCDM